MEPFPNVDVTTEVLSRLPAETLLASKATSKSWESLIANNLFLCVHAHRSKDIYGLFVQQTWPSMDFDFDFLNYISVSKYPSKVQDAILDFLLEDVVLIASCNGLLCCRSCIHPTQFYYTSNLSEYGGGRMYTRPIHRKFRTREWKEKSRKKLMIYICNPATRECIAIKPVGCPMGEAFGLSFSLDLDPSFKLVSIRPLQNDPGTHSFVIYSSKTDSWKTSKEVCKFNSEFYTNRVIFTNGRFHWLMHDHHIITFDVERELSQIIKLPGLTPIAGKCSQGICLGESEGCFHYVCAFIFELQVWILKDYDGPEWVLKYSLPLIDFCKEHSRIFDPDCILEDEDETGSPENLPNNYLTPLTFYNEVLFMMIFDQILSYNFKSRMLVNHCCAKPLGSQFNVHPTVLPYSVCLASLCDFKGAAGKVSGHTSEASCRAYKSSRTRGT